MNYSLIEARNEIKNVLKNTLNKLKYKCEIKVEIPPEGMGDFAFPCFQLSAIAKKSPNDIAKEIANNIDKTQWIDKVETKGAYVNFIINNEKLKYKTLKTILKKNKKYGFLKNKNKKVIIEHTSANPNGPLHVGRARNPIIGDTLVRIFKTAGYDVESQFYLDDMGKQVAILAWGVNNLDAKDVPKSDYNKSDHKTVGFYQLASKLKDENIEISNEIGKIVKSSEEGKKETIDMVHKAYFPVLKGIKESLKKINISVDKYVPESNFVKDKSVEKVVKELKKSKYCGKEEDAFFIDMKPFGIKGRNTNFFFLRSNGTTLYATRDVAYHIWKAKNADFLVNVLGEDHKLESKQVEIALKLIGEKKLPNAVFYSFVSLPGGKMSTRKGRVVYLDDLIEESINRAYKEVNKRRGNELTKEKMNKISEIIGIGAIRYNLIKVQPEKDIVFKWEEALNFEGNSAPFIQYSHARACSILSKNKEKIKDFDGGILKHDSEEKLIKKISELPIVIDNAYKGFKPHLIANFLFDLASQFNQFYRDCPVIFENNEKLRKSRLALVDATRIALKNGLDILGITAPEEM